MRLVRACALAAALALLASSCAPPPGTVSPAPPPAQAPAPAQPAPPRAGRISLNGEPWVKVGLATDLDTIRVNVVQACRYLQGGSEIPLHASRLEITDRDGMLRIRPMGSMAGAPSVEFGVSDTFSIVPGNPREPAVLWRGRNWRGEFRCFLGPRGRLTLVARLPLETYLLGVVPGEIGALAEDLLEAGRAQAIAARSYTLFYLGRRVDEGFDLYGSVEDQVYGPLESEKPLATRCVTTTRGQVSLSEGWPIRANYCGTCGGITSDVWEAWPVEPLGYLVSHRDRVEDGPDFCASSPQYRWREEWTPSEFAANLARWAPQFSVPLPDSGLGDVVDVSVAARSRSGRVWRLEVTTTNGRIEIPAYCLRQVLRRGSNPGAILRSNLFKIDVLRNPITQRTTAIVASGAGNGHGAGLCQTGAIGMARAKHDAAAILAHYYRGAELERLY